MKHDLLKKLLIVVLTLVFGAFYLPLLSADDDTPQAQADVIDMIAGDIQSVTVNNMTRVSVTNPEVADIADAQSNKVSLVAKRAGNTVLFIWDADGKRSIKVRVASEDLESLKARIAKILEEAKIPGISLEANLDIGKVVLAGDLSKDDKTRLEDILAPYSDNLLNLVREEKNEELIQVDMQIVEIDTSYEKNLGILWGTPASSSGSSGTGTTTINGQTVNTSTSPPNSGQIGLNYNELLPNSNGSIGDFFKIGNFYRTTSLEATVNALIQEGKAHLISKPRLVVVSGKEASFLVGGEIPIQSSTVSTTGSSITSNTTYAQYGVNLTVTPTIRDSKIDVLLNVDIRDIDSATPISSSGNGNDVAFVTRTASTDLLLDNKQTIVLAGLIKYEDNNTSTEIPFLSKIPILGALFRNSSVGSPSPNTKTEMVVILTPMVLTEKKIEDKQLVMPTPDERSTWKGVDSKYEHEPLVSSWPPAKAEMAVSDDSSNDPDVLSAETTYARMVQEKISRAISYPQQADGNAGTVRLKLHILKDGSLDSEELMESSGNDTLDQDAMQAAKAAAPFDAFTAGMDQDEVVFTVPIVYNRFISQEQTSADDVVPSY